MENSFPANVINFMTLKEQAIQNLQDFKEILGKIGIVFWLDGGTLLGAWRDGDFPQDDEDDIDIGTWFNYAIFKKQIIEEAQKIGFELYHEWEWQIAMKRGGSKIDLFFHNKKGLDAYHFLYKGEQGIPAVVPAHFFEKLFRLQFNGIDLLIPNEINEYLTIKYGDWHTPIHRKDYAKAGGCYNPEVNKVLRLDYDYT